MDTLSKDSRSFAILNDYCSDVLYSIKDYNNEFCDPRLYSYFYGMKIVNIQFNNFRYRAIRNRPRQISELIYYKKYINPDDKLFKIGQLPKYILKLGSSFTTFYTLYLLSIIHNIQIKKKNLFSFMIAVLKKNNLYNKDTKFSRNKLGKYMNVIIKHHMNDYGKNTNNQIIEFFDKFGDKKYKKFLDIFKN